MLTIGKRTAPSSIVGLAADRRLTFPGGAPTAAGGLLDAFRTDGYNWNGVIRVWGVKVGCGGSEEPKGW